MTGADRPRRSNPGGHSRASLAVLAVCAIVLTLVFVALGIWQLERRVWKHALIARVEQRIHAPAVDAPGPLQWQVPGAANNEYLRVTASGVFLNDQETLVQASTALGSGFWVMTPLRTTAGFIVLVNRGFVPPDKRERAARATTETSTAVTVTGLIRLSQPGGGFLRKNDAAADRWFSRDVQAIAMKRQLPAVAPYFIDADAAPQANPSAQAWPTGGLTVVSFPDSHMVYALTWFGMAIMTVAAGWLLLRRPARRD